MGTKEECERRCVLGFDEDQNEITTVAPTKMTGWPWPFPTKMTRRPWPQSNMTGRPWPFPTKFTRRPPKTTQKPEECPLGKIGDPCSPFVLMVQCCDDLICRKHRGTKMGGYCAVPRCGEDYACPKGKKCCGLETLCNHPKASCKVLG